MEASSKPGHIGRKIARIRELRSIKQDTLAFELGVSQQTVSRMEASETIEDEVLEKVAKVLGVRPEALKAFDEDSVINYFNNFYDQSGSGAFFSSTNLHCTFNAVDKIVELFEENKKLYERLLASEREKIEILKANQR